MSEASDMTEQTESAEVEVARAAATLYDEVRAAVIAEPIGSLARRLHTALGNLAHAVLTSEPAAAAEVETLSCLEAACLEGLIVTPHGWRYRPSKGAAAILASDWLAADRAAAEGRGAERVLAAVRARFNAPDAPTELDAALRDILAAARAATGGGS